MKDFFSAYHPAVNFLYFAAVLLFSMFLLHPAFLCAGLVSALLYAAQLRRGGAKRLFSPLLLLPLVLLMALLNPLFNHAGITALFYLYNGNPVTLESVLYGAASAVLFLTVIVWFFCYNAVMTSDKFIYLFGRRMPALSLLFSMTLRFVPRYKTQIQVISAAQKCVGRDVSSGTLRQRAGNGMKILSIMTTWALENAIETADSMKARGYGLPGRSAFSIFRFSRRDACALSSVLALSAATLAGLCAGAGRMDFFPLLHPAPLGALGIGSCVAYLALCLMPVVINLWEALKWRRFRSGI